MYTLEHKLLGSLKFHETYGWWEGKASFPNGESCILYLKCSKEKSEELDGLEGRYSNLVNNIVEYKLQVSEKAVEIYNAQFKKAEEEPMTKENFADTISVQVLEIMKDGASGIFFNGGELLEGRIIVMEFTESGTVSSIEVMGC